MKIDDLYENAVRKLGKREKSTFDELVSMRSRSSEKHLSINAKASENKSLFNAKIIENLAKKNYIKIISKTPNHGLKATTYTIDILK